MKIRRAGGWVVTIVAFILAVSGLRAHAADPGHVRSLLAEGQYAEAENEARAQLLETARIDESTSLEVAEALDLTVEVLLRTGKTYVPDALELAERAVDVRRESLGPEHPSLAQSLDHLAQVASARDDLDRARSLSEEALAIAESAFGPSDPLVGRILVGLAPTLVYQGEHARARQVCERALAIQDAALPPDSRLTAETLYRLGWVLRRMGDRAAARTKLERAVVVAEDAHGPSHPMLAPILNQLGILLGELGEHDAAFASLERALAIGESVHGPEHPVVAVSSFGLGFVHQRRGEYQKARALHERALDIQRRTVGREHTSVASTLHSLGWLLNLMGEYGPARECLETSVSISERVFGPDHARMVYPLSAYGLVHLQTGDFGKARAVFERCVTISRNLSPPQERLLAVSLANLSAVFMQTGDYEEAWRLYDEALPALERTYGPDHMNVLESKSYAARLLASAGGTDEAIRRFEQALEHRERVLGSDHPSLALDMRDLARLLAGKGQLFRANELLERSREILEKAHGPDAIHVGRTLVPLARVFAERGKPGKAMATALRAERIGRASLRLTAPMLAERQALRYNEVRASGLNLALSLLAERAGTGFSAETLDALIRSRALVLDEMAARNRSIVASADPEVIRLAEELASSRADLARITLTGPAGGTLESYLALVDGAALRKEEAERALAARSVAFRRDLALRRVGLAEVAAAIPEGGALVAFASYNHATGVLVPETAQPGAGQSQEPAQREVLRAEKREPPLRRKAAPSYLAFVLRAGGDQPSVVPLGPRQRIDPLIHGWRDEVGAPPRGLRGTIRAREKRYREAGARLRKAVWDPLVAEIGEARQIFIVPDGGIHLMNFATLPTDATNYFLETGPAIHYLSAERDLVPLDSATPVPGALLALGGPDFDHSRPGVPDTQPSLIADGEIGSPHGAGLPPAVYRSPAPSCEGFLSEPFSPLPRSHAEAVEIGALWSGVRADDDANESKVLTLTGPAADEAAFKRLAPDYRMIHVATHAYFMQDRCLSLVDMARQSAGGGAGFVESNTRLKGDNPLLLSGLALAGANHKDEAGPDAEDGILTAEEIASLDLSGTDWVVLSGCQTGLGKIVEGEGVLGLQRAFRIAGVRTLIMSLWLVGDEPARDWMKRLYEARRKGESTVDAVHQASIDVLRARRRTGKSTHPFYWGAFVAAGDWR